MTIVWASRILSASGRRDRNGMICSSTVYQNGAFRSRCDMMNTMDETTPISTPLSGRRAQAARNDQRILDAARAVFTADPEAPISAVAERAEVGIGALYRRYRSKDELLQQLASDGLRRYISVAADALAAHGDPWLVLH